jgi:hypothetical protein
MFVGDLPKELLTTNECLLEAKIRTAMESLERTSEVTEADLRCGPCRSRVDSLSLLPEIFP